MMTSVGSVTEQRGCQNQLLPCAYRVALLESLQDGPQSIVQNRQRSGGDVSGDVAVVRFGHRSGDAREGVGVAAKGDGLPDGIFEVGRLEERDQSRRDGSSARHVELVRGSKPLQRLAEVVAEHLLDRFLDLTFALALPREKDGGGGGLRPFDPF